jgi:ComF family protein
VAIGGTADEPLTGTAPPYPRRQLALRHVDEACAAPALNSHRGSRHGFVFVSLGEYRGELRRAVHHMKFRNRRFVAARFGRHLARAVRQHSGEWRPDVVSWAPTTARRIRDRGHDQSAIIAASLARELRVRRVRTLRRSDDNTQTGASRESRMRGPRFVVRVRSVRGRRILLVDDVMTTGTTLARARTALLEAGAREVRCAVVAHVRATGRAQVVHG